MKYNSQKIVVEELAQQVTKDEFFQSMISRYITADLLAFSYMLRPKKTDITIVDVQKADFTLQILKPMLKDYLRNKEKALGKKKSQFTEKERIETLKEMENLVLIYKQQGLIYY